MMKMSTIMVMVMLTMITMADGEDYINVARGKPAKQKNTLYGGDAQRAVDGNYNPSWGASSCTHTDAPPTWWMVDLLGQYKIVAVRLTNRNSFQEKLRQFSVYVSITNPQKHSGFPSSLPGQQCVYHSSIVNGTETIPCTSPVYGRYLIIYKAANEVLTLCEVEVLTTRSLNAVTDAQFTLWHSNTRSSHQLLYNTSGISTAIHCSALCLKTPGGPATLLQHNELSQQCECIRFSELDTSDYLIISDMGWNLYSDPNN